MCTAVAKTMGGKYQSWTLGSERNAILNQLLEPKTTDVLLHSSVKSSLSLPKLKN